METFSIVRDFLLLECLGFFPCSVLTRSEGNSIALAEWINAMQIPTCDSFTYSVVTGWADSEQLTVWGPGLGLCSMRNFWRVHCINLQVSMRVRWGCYQTEHPQHTCSLLCHFLSG